MSTVRHRANLEMLEFAQNFQNAGRVLGLVVMHGVTAPLAT